MRFRVPASTTNLAHGFDCFGIALSAANEVIIDETVNELSGNATLQHMIDQTRDIYMQRTRHAVPRLIISITGDVPAARGMGSSSTIYAAGLAACQRFAGKDIDLGQIIRIGSELEGHPDNICAAVLGGFTIVATVAGRLQWQRFAVPENLQAVITIPDYEVKTEDARKVLPQQFSITEGVLAIQRSSMISAALASGRLEMLHGLFQDGWHEHYRAQLNPHLGHCRQIAAEAGAIATFLSGSGSCILSLCTKSNIPMVKEALEAQRPDNAKIRALTFDNNGLELLDD